MVSDVAETRQEEVVPIGPVRQAPAGMGGISPQPATAETPGVRLGQFYPISEDATVLADSKEVRFTYRCKKCGHEWSEERFKATEAKAPGGYAGD